MPVALTFVIEDVDQMPFDAILTIIATEFSRSQRLEVVFDIRGKRNSNNIFVKDMYSLLGSLFVYHRKPCARNGFKFMGNFSYRGLASLPLPRNKDISCTHLKATTFVYSPYSNEMEGPNGQKLFKGFEVTRRAYPSQICSLQ